MAGVEAECRGLGLLAGVEAGAAGKALFSQIGLGLGFAGSITLMPLIYFLPDLLLVLMVRLFG